jgi:UDP-N-acetylglucosamine 1-carboxyvinyltransferase
MAQYIIQGGKPLNGSIAPLGNKNAVLPMIAASLLTDEPLVLTNVPDIKDVATMLQLLQSLGAEIHQNKVEHRLEICCRGVRTHRLIDDRVARLRASIYFIGGLLARRRQVEIDMPGGCQIGRRQIDTHLLNLSKLGVQVDYGCPIKAHASKLKGGFVWSDEMSVTATANFILAAALAEGESVLYNAASEPHIQDFCILLNKMGARISGIGCNRIVIEGVESLHGTTHEVVEDYVEVGSFIAAAVVTNGRLCVQNVGVGYYNQILYQLTKLGIDIRIENHSLIAEQNQGMVIQPMMDGGLPQIECLPWPGFPADLLQIALVLATQCEGKLLIHDKLFESRLFFVDKLIRMGADIFLSDPHRAIVFGRSKLKGKFIESPDLRAGMALVIAGLAAEGESIIDNIEFIERGYESLDERLRSLGADITRRV